MKKTEKTNGADKEGGLQTKNRFGNREVNKTQHTLTLYI